MAHEPIQFGRRSEDAAGGVGPVSEADAKARPVGLDLKKDEALTVTWDDGRVSVYPVRYLRRMSPSAEAQQLRAEMARNPLTVLKAGSTGGGSEGFAATGAEMVGNYAVRIEFSDGHRTGIYTWPYLRQIDPDRPAGEAE